MKSYKPCNLFEVGGRTSVVRQMVATLARVFSRTLTESLMAIIGEDVGIRVETDYPVNLPRDKDARYSRFVWENEVRDSSSLLLFDNALCCALLEKVCGGIGTITESIDILTPTEHRFAERIALVVIEQLGRASGIEEPLKLVRTRDSENKLSLRTTMCEFDLHIYTEAFTGQIKVWLPEDVMLAAVSHEKVNRTTLFQALGHLPLDVNAILSRHTMSLGQVLALQAGDDLPLTLPSTAEVYSSSVLLGHARVVARNNFLALELEKLLLNS